MFQDKIVLFENFKEPLHLGNNIPTLSAVAKIDLDSDQKYTFARIFVQVCGGSFSGLAFRAEFNGKTLGSQTWGPFENQCKALDVPVTDLMKNGNNTLKIHLDGRLATQDVTIFADLLYHLNTIDGPKRVEVGDPEKDSILKQVVPIVIGVAAAAMGVAVVIALINRHPARKALSLIQR